MMSEIKQLSRDELKRLRPATYLQPRGGFDNVRDARELAGNFATAACMALEDAEASPQELLTVYEAIKQCLALSVEANPAKKIRQSVTEALGVASSLLDKEVNRGIAAWIRECVPLVQTDSGVEAFLQHLTSVVEQYALIVSVKFRE